MSDDLVAQARAAQHDERLSTGALYGALADEIERLGAEVALANDGGELMAKHARTWMARAEQAEARYVEIQRYCYVEIQRYCDQVDAGAESKIRGVTATCEEHKAEQTRRREQAEARVAELREDLLRALRDPEEETK